MNFTALDDLAAMEAGTSFPTAPTKLRTQPPFEEDGVYKIHTDCECEWHTSYLGKKIHRKDLPTPISKIVPKTALSGSKLLEEKYCQSAQKQCKLLSECDWHKSAYASEYYRQTDVHLNDVVERKPKISAFVDEQQIQVLTQKEMDYIQEQQEKNADRKPSVRNIKADFEKFLDQLQLRNKENSSNFLLQNYQPRQVSDGFHRKNLDDNTEAGVMQERKEFFDFLRLKRKENPTSFLSQLNEGECRQQNKDDHVLPKVEPNEEGRKKSKKKKKKNKIHNTPRNS